MIWTSENIQWRSYTNYTLITKKKLKDTKKIDELIKKLRQYKKDVFEIEKNSHRQSNIDCFDNRFQKISAKLNYDCIQLKVSQKKIWKIMLEEFETQL